MIFRWINKHPRKQKSMRSLPRCLLYWISPFNPLKISPEYTGAGVYGEIRVIAKSNRLQRVNEWVLMVYSNTTVYWEIEYGKSVVTCSFSLLIDAFEVQFSGLHNHRFHKATAQPRPIMRAVRSLCENGNAVRSLRENGDYTPHHRYW